LVQWERPITHFIELAGDGLVEPDLAIGQDKHPMIALTAQLGAWDRSGFEDDPVGACSRKVLDLVDPGSHSELQTHVNRSLRRLGERQETLLNVLNSICGVAAQVSRSPVDEAVQPQPVLDGQPRPPLRAKDD
jgi:hypothetical protein